MERMIANKPNFLMKIIRQNEPKSKRVFLIVRARLGNLKR
jgi:hypothetical protein